MLIYKTISYYYNDGAHSTGRGGCERGRPCAGWAPGDPAQHCEKEKSQHLPRMSRSHFNFHKIAIKNHLHR
jgi:hypothetical protein